MITLFCIERVLNSIFRWGFQAISLEKRQESSFVVVVSLDKITSAKNQMLYLANDCIFLCQVKCLLSSCSNGGQLQGKITKPKMWSRILDSHEISILAAGCGIFRTSGDIVVRQASPVFLGKRAVSYGECTAGKGEETFKSLRFTPGGPIGAQMRVFCG